MYIFMKILQYNGVMKYLIIHLVETDEFLSIYIAFVIFAEYNLLGCEMKFVCRNT